MKHFDFFAFLYFKFAFIFFIGYITREKGEEKYKSNSYSFILFYTNRADYKYGVMRRMEHHAKLNF